MIKLIIAQVLLIALMSSKPQNSPSATDNLETVKRSFLQNPSTPFEPFAFALLQSRPPTYPPERHHLAGRLHVSEMLYLVYALGLFAALRTLGTLMQQERTIEQHRYLVKWQQEQYQKQQAEIEKRALEAMAAVAMPTDNTPTPAKKAA
jgi:Ca2+/H+ antiporter